MIKTQNKHIVTLLLWVFLLLLISCAEHNIGDRSINIIPKPLKVEMKKGTFRITAETKILVEGNSGGQGVAEYLALQISKAGGYALRVEINTGENKMDNTIVLSTDHDDEKFGKEGYLLEVDNNMVSIKAAKPAGFFYGVQTLLQLLPAQIYGVERSLKKDNWSLPAVHIFDKPHFSWRGMHLDVARHFFSKEALKKYIDMLAMHKMNILHLHLCDDQGWRIEIKKYPKLVEIGSRRPDLPWNDWQENDAKSVPVYSGYYSQEDVKEIVAYARERFVTIVPEIEMPGHTLAALAAYPEYSCTGGPFTVPSGGVDIWKNHTYCIGNEQTYKFLEDVLNEVMELFPSKYIHIGGDETTRLRWENCPKCQARIRRENLKDEDGLYGYFLDRIGNFIKSKNRIMVGWDEILEGGDRVTGVVMAWRGTDRTIKAVKRGFDVVQTPSSHLYFDNNEVNGEIHIPLEMVYTYNPLPYELNGEQAKHILGAQACVWTENVTTMEQVEQIALPRMAALAEVDWTNKNQQNFEDFIRRMAHQYDRYEAMNLHYRQPDMEGGFSGMHIFSDSIQVKIINARLNTEVRYTLDDSDPTRQSLRYTGPFFLKENARIKAVEIMPDGKMGRIRSGIYEKQKPLEALEVKNIKPGISFKYREGKYESTEQIPLENFKKFGILEQFVLPPDHLKHFFAVIYSGFIHIKNDGIYTFYCETNDGSRLYINDKLVVDHGGLHPAEEKAGSVALRSGLHPIRVIYFQNAGAYSIKISYKGENIKKQVIPPDLLFH